MNNLQRDLISTERRQHLRIHFPISDRPNLSIDMDLLKVSDLSQTGLKARMAAGEAYKVGENIFADLMFLNGWIVKIQATVVRAGHNEIVLKFR